MDKTIRPNRDNENTNIRRQNEIQTSLVSVQCIFGNQEFFEFVLPVTIRYKPKVAFLPGLKSFGFGLGLSHTTKVPQVEIDMRGESARNLVYWLAETAISVGDSEDELTFLVHHRSDAFGLLNPDTGSNAFAVGWRRSY